jgi:OOP family OmpA-OmpF porin
MKIKAWQIQILGILALALLFIIAIPLFSKRIPLALQTHLSQHFIEQGHDWVNVDSNGRNITISGNAPTKEASSAASKLIDNYKPMLQINDQITPRLIQPYSMKMDWNGQVLILNGYLLNQTHYKKLIVTSHQQLDKTSVQDKLKLGAGAPKNWYPLIETSLQGLLKLQRGYIEITNQSFYFSGQTPYSSKRDNITQSLNKYSQYQKKIHIIAADEKNKTCQTKFKHLLTRSIKFNSGKASIDKSSHPLLTQLANTAALCSHLNISIEGHTDHRGQTIDNKKLSLQRAQAVVNWLFQQGIAEHQLSAIGHGAQQPIADNSTEEGRAANRRIEFIVKERGDQ